MTSERPQRLRHVSRRVEPLARVLRQRTLEHAFQEWRDVAAKRVQRREWGMAMEVECVHGSVARERGAAGEELEEGRSERIQVRPMIDVAAARLLRGHVGWGASQQPTPAQ